MNRIFAGQMSRMTLLLQHQETQHFQKKNGIDDTVFVFVLVMFYNVFQMLVQDSGFDVIQTDIIYIYKRDNLHTYEENTSCAPVWFLVVCVVGIVCLLMN